MKNIMGRDVAEAMLDNIYDELCIDVDFLDGEEDEKDRKRLISALMQGRLEYDNEVFTLNLLKSITKGKESLIEKIIIKEPTGVQLRSMSQIKKKSDDVGKAMAVLGDVTGLGLPVINKLGGRDMMVAQGVISLFL